MDQDGLAAGARAPHPGRPAPLAHGVDRGAGQLLGALRRADLLEDLLHGWGLKEVNKSSAPLGVLEHLVQELLKVVSHGAPRS